MVLAREVIQGFREKGLRKGPWGSLPLTALLLAGLVTVLIYASNTPKSLTAEIPVTYLVDITTHELPPKPRGDGPYGGFSYDQARVIFKRFIENTPRVAASIDATFRPSPGPQVNPGLAWQTFHDFIEYLVVYYLGAKSGAADLRTLQYRREVGRGLAFPDPSIRGKDQPLSQITGVLRENLFSSLDLDSMDTIVSKPGGTLDFWMPKDTYITDRCAKNLTNGDLRGRDLRRQKATE